jgi:ABC-type lipoprotein release transport system permease subunit
VKLLAIESATGLALGILATRVLAGVVLAMALLGLVPTWIPAQRALSVDPLVLLREE